MVIESAVIAAVLLSLTPSSSKKPPLELITVASVTPPLPVPTVSAIVTLALRAPLVPVMVTLVVPAVAVLDAVKVTVLVVVVDAGLMLAVTPAGKPLTAPNVTVPVNPFTGTTVIVLLPLPPCAKVSAAGAAVNLKLG